MKTAEEWADSLENALNDRGYMLDPSECERFAHLIRAIQADAQASLLRRLREPSPEMIDAFHEAIRKWHREEGEDADVFRAMIDAALQGKRE
jgi:hypothetical protein